jgi:hypothetical protein
MDIATVAGIARYRLDLDSEGSIAALDGVLPVCTQDSVLEET